MEHLEHQDAWTRQRHVSTTSATLTATVAPPSTHRRHQSSAPNDVRTTTPTSTPQHQHQQQQLQVCGTSSSGWEHSVSQQGVMPEPPCGEGMTRQLLICWMSDYLHSHSVIHSFVRSLATDLNIYCAAPPCVLYHVTGRC